MKKYILVLLVVIFIIPSVAFASWYNPFSWNWFSFFNKNNTVPQTVQVNNISTKTSNNTTPINPSSLSPSAVSKTSSKNPLVVSKMPVNNLPTAKPLDCGTSDSCFSNNVKVCRTSFATISDQGPMYIEKVDSHNNGVCNISLTYTDASFPGNGKSMICHIPDSALRDFKNYLHGRTMLQSCSGTLIDFLIKNGAK